MCVSIQVQQMLGDFESRLQRMEARIVTEAAAMAKTRVRTNVKI